MGALNAEAACRHESRKGCRASVARAESMRSTPLTTSPKTRPSVPFEGSIHTPPRLLNEDARTQNDSNDLECRQTAMIMTTEHQAKVANGKSIAPIAPRWTGRNPQTSSTTRLQTSTPSPILCKDPQASRSNVSTPTTSKEDVTTPVKNFLSSNVTPRSGSRKARVDGVSPTPRRTPESTPPSARPVSMIEGRDWPSSRPKAANGIGSQSGRVSRSGRASSVASDVQFQTDGGPARGSRNASPDGVAKFFHANDARPRQNTRAQSPNPRAQSRPAGAQLVTVNGDGPSHIVSSSPEGEGERPKFFYANGNQDASPPATKPPNGAFPARPPLQTIFSSYQTSTSPAQRPPSPLKEEILPVSRKSSLSKPASRRHTRLVSIGSNDIRAPESMGKGSSELSRRSSLNKPMRKISRPQSPSNFDVVSSRRSSITFLDVGVENMLDDSPDPALADSSPTRPSSSILPDTAPPQSSSKPSPGQSKLEHLNELAANARRERKVLDLEISNSSLLAINRTLETEMRKQKAELRQLRRLRSSGRFASSTRSPSSRFSMLSTTDDLSPTSSADEDGMDNDRFSNLSGTSDDTSLPDSLNFSPTMRQSSLSVAKGRQSRSFKVDMSAQRLLLLDSQKLNQALKRCLGRTDELIADGKKALDYKVNTEEGANKGPRVLSPNHHDEEFKLGRGLLSPGLDEKIGIFWEKPETMDESWHAPLADSSRKDGSHDTAQIDRDRENHAVEVQHPDERGISYQPHEPESVPDNLIAGEENLNQKTQDLEDILYNDLGLGPRVESPTREIFPLEASDSVEIPYEDPGIDTGGDTSAIEDDESTTPEATPLELQRRDPLDSKSRDVSSERSGEEAGGQESEDSSPGKGLGNFLRLVGGSWGV